MTRLLIAELRRIASRRLVRLTVALAAVGIVLGGLAAFVFSASLSEEAYQQRVADAKREQVAIDARIGPCLEAHGLHPGDEIPDDVARECFPNKSARADDPRFHRARLRGVLQGVTGGLAVVGWALGASLVGAEFASRSMTTLLTWETRRGRVFLTKAVAAIAAMSLFSLVVLALVGLAMWPSVAFHGAPFRPGDPTLTALAGTVGRGVALTAVAAGMGFAIATIGRNTAAALGAGFAYIIVLENILGSSIERWRRWLLLGNVIVFVSGHNGGADIPGRTVIGAGVFLTAVALTLLVVAATSFRTRDLA
jgi:ABC-type transport system involved in multi-copper enzyme maturation permease subunit